MSAASPLSIDDLIAALPPRIWYLTSNGVDMYCRRPYSFWFSTGQLAEAFAGELGSDGLSAIGVDTRDLLGGDAAFSSLRDQQITPIFLDPAIDPESGDVFGKILRLGELN